MFEYYWQVFSLIQVLEPLQHGFNGVVFPLIYGLFDEFHEKEETGKVKL